MVGKIVFSLFVLGIIMYGRYFMMFELEYNRCAMTYMYELPRYQKIPMDSRITKQFPKYSLYFYGEGHYFTKYRSRKILQGIPVLFIPGNAGSYKQVRSLASVALRMSESNGKSQHFNYFSLDFNEKLSAMYGDFIQLQTHFAVKCIEIIRTKYESPTPVIVIGHSMGGIVARNMYHSFGFKAVWVDTIITLATPHLQPVVPVDAVMRAIYDRIDLVWRRSDRQSLANVTLVSFTGGSRDVQVRDGLGDVTGLDAVRSRSFWRSTSAVYKAWTSTDHQCVVWCKQIVMNINRALFDMIDESENRVIADAGRRMKIFRRHFDVDISKELKNENLTTAPLSSNADWIYEESSVKFTFQREEVRSPIFIKFGPFNSQEKFQSVLVASGVKHAWLFLCQSSDLREPCTSMIDVSSWAKAAPPEEINRKVLHLDPKLFEAYEDPVYLVVHLQTTKKEIEVFYERYNRAKRHITRNPGLTDFFAGIPLANDLTDWMVIPKTQTGAIYYRILLPEFYHLRQGLEVKIRVLSCSGTAGSVGLISFYSPWDGYSTHSSLWYWNNASLNLHLATSRPADYEKEAMVELILDPTCQYRVYLHHSIAEIASQFIRVYLAFIPAYLVIHILGGLGLQLMHAARNERVPSVISIKSPVPLILPSVLMGFLFNWLPESVLLLIETDTKILQRDGMYFPLYMQVLFIVSIAFFVLHYLLCQLFVFLLAFPLCRQGSRLPCRVVSHVFGLFCALSAIYFASKVCGGIATLILFIGQLLLTAIDRASTQTVEDSDLHHIRFTVLMLLGFLAAIQSPSTIVWIKLFSDNSFKTLPTPIGLGSLSILLSFAFLSLARSTPGVWIRKPGLTRAVAILVLVIAVASPLFFSFALHRLQWGVATALSVMGIVALISKAFGGKDRRPHAECAHTCDIIGEINITSL